MQLHFPRKQFGVMTRPRELRIDPARGRCFLNVAPRLSPSFPILGTRAVKIRASDMGHSRDRFGGIVPSLSAIIAHPPSVLLRGDLFSSRDERFPRIAGT